MRVSNLNENCSIVHHLRTTAENFGKIEYLGVTDIAPD